MTEKNISYLYYKPYLQLCCEEDGLSTDEIIEVKDERVLRTIIDICFASLPSFITKSKKITKFTMGFKGKYIFAEIISNNHLNEEEILDINEFLENIDEEGIYPIRYKDNTFLSLLEYTHGDLIKTVD